MVDFLSKSYESNLPTGGDLPAGFTGKWLAVIRWAFLIEENPTDFPDEVTRPDNYRAAGSWFRCYYKDGDVAAKAAIALGEQYPPEQTWLYEAPIDTVFLPEEVKLKFGASISMETRVKTLGSAKHRHEFHLITLPAAVGAYAVMRGWVDSEYELSELTDRDSIVTDEISANLIGGEYFNIIQEANITVPYTESTLWKRREALWAALGETNPAVYLPIGVGGKEKYTTTSQRLSEALAITQDWSSAVWARVAMVQNPRVDAVSKKSGNRLTVPALLQIFESEEDASDAAGLVDDSGETAPAVNPSTPTVPTAWEGAEDAWRTQVADLKAKTGNVPVPVARVKITEMMDGGLNIAATTEEVVAWWAEV